MAELENDNPKSNRSDQPKRIIWAALELVYNPAVYITLGILWLLVFVGFLIAFPMQPRTAGFSFWLISAILVGAYWCIVKFLHVLEDIYEHDYRAGEIDPESIRPTGEHVKIQKPKRVYRSYYGYRQSKQPEQKPGFKLIYLMPFVILVLFWLGLLIFVPVDPNYVGKSFRAFPYTCAFSSIVFVLWAIWRWGWRRGKE